MLYDAFHTINKFILRCNVSKQHRKHECVADSVNGDKPILAEYGINDYFVPDDTYKENEVLAKTFGVTLAHKFFEHLGGKDRCDIVVKIACKKAHIVAFYLNGKLKCAAIYELIKDGIHLREAGGDFIFMFDWLEKYAQGLAHSLGVKVLTFRTKFKSVMLQGIRKGYKVFNSFEDGSKEFKKVTV